MVESGFYDSIGLYRSATPEQTEASQRWMERMGVCHLAGQSLGRVAPGEQRLVLLARAIVKEPELLILDEPCQGLDRANRTRVLRTIEWIATHSGSTTIYVTHDVDEVPRTTTHVLELEDGRIRQQGVLQDRSAGAAQVGQVGPAVAHR